MHIGVLALQGGFSEHVRALCVLGSNAIEVRRPSQVDGLDGLVIPGGESTTIGKLAVDYGLVEPIRAMARDGKAVWGTCAGAITMARELHREQPLLDVMDIVVRRNAFGRQVDSFQLDIDIGRMNSGDDHRLLFNAVFIRAPIIESVGSKVDVMARLPTGEIVAAQEGKMLATVFHPELTDDCRVHEYFLSLCAHNS